MHQNFIEKLYRLPLVKMLYESPAPRWSVLLADTLIVAFSCLLTFTFSTGISGVGVMFSPAIKTMVVVAVYVATSMAIRSYQYIIRLSVLEDVYRLVSLVLSSSVLLAVANLVVGLITGGYYISFWNIFIIGMLSFTFMMCMRLLIKYLYARLSAVNGRRRPVIVLGSALNSFVLANALRTEADGAFSPVALLSLFDSNSECSVNGIPIVRYEPDCIKEIFEKYHCDTLLFLSTQMEFMRSGFSDAFLENHIKLLVLNQVEEFDTNRDAMPNLSSHVKAIKIEDLLGREPIKNDNPDISRLIKDQVVMITGAAGSIGSEITRQVAQFGAREIVLLDQAETPMHYMQLEMEDKFPDTKIHLYVGDIVNKQRMERAFSLYRPRYVFHAAAYKHVPMMERNPSEAVFTNVFGTKNLADLALKYNVEKFVMISTDKAVNPTNVMGATKRLAEIYVQSLFLDRQRNTDRPLTQFITTRFGNVLGSNGSVIPRFRQQIEEGGPVTVTHRDIIRYFMTIPEACSLVLEAGCMGHGGEIYIFDMGKPIKIYDLACRMISLAGLRVGQDIEIVETGLRPGEKLYEELLNDKERTMATHHRKIMVAKVETYRYEDVVRRLEKLFTLINGGDVRELILELKHIIPEYKSQNSRWAELDEVIAGEARNATADAR